MLNVVNKGNFWQQENAKHLTMAELHQAVKNNAAVFIISRSVCLWWMLQLA